MLRQYRTFFGAVAIIFFTTLLILAMYTYTVNTSLDIIREDIKQSNLNRLRILVHSLDFNVEQLDLLSMAVNTDSKLRLLKSVDLMNNFEQDQLLLDVSEKMKLQRFAQGWDMQIAVYSTLLKKWAGSSQVQTPPPDPVVDGKWFLDPNRKIFSMYRAHDRYYVHVSFPQSNVERLLNSAKLENNDPFFYHPDFAVIANRSSNRAIIRELIAGLSPNMQGRNEGTELITVGGTEYMVNYLRSAKLGWYLIDYVPLGEALRPIVRTQMFFYATCVLLFLSGAVTVLFFYRKVQVPILTLLHGVRRIKKGEYSHRISTKGESEFDILYHNFNDMAQQIEELIEKVYKEQIASREAQIKQLQAQINPHFLYNCLFFINNMNRLGNDEAVTAMTQNLAEYFRYTTRLNEPVTTLEKEIGVVRNYLNIQCLRMNRLQYDINIPTTMMSLTVPKLLVQPLVENGIIHGIEKKQSAGKIRISGAMDGNRCRIVVEDDGKGMEPEEIAALLDRIGQPPDDSMGCALWNIRQRMLIHFGPDSKLHIEPSELGGLRVELTWPQRAESDK